LDHAIILLFRHIQEEYWNVACLLQTGNIGKSDSFSDSILLMYCVPRSGFPVHRLKSYKENPTDYKKTQNLELGTVNQSQYNYEGTR